MDSKSLTLIFLLVFLPALGIAAEAPRITFVAGKDFPATEVSRETLVQIFLLKDKKIDQTEVDIVQYRTDSVERDLFAKSFLHMTPGEETLYWQQKLVSEGWRPPKTKVNAKVVLIFLLRNPNTIGYIIGPATDLPDGLKAIKVK